MPFADPATMCDTCTMRCPSAPSLSLSERSQPVGPRGMAPQFHRVFPGHGLQNTRDAAGADVPRGRHFARQPDRLG